MRLCSLGKRILTAVAGIPLLLYLTGKGGIFFVALVAFIILMSIVEFSAACSNGGIRIRRGLVIVACMGIVLLFARPEAAAMLRGYSYSFLLCGWLIFLVSRVPITDKGLLRRLPSSLLGIFYLGLLPVHLLLLRNVAGTIVIAGHNIDKGFALIVWLYLLVWTVDTGAYAVGKVFGRRRVFPLISPNKTLEGFLGGLLFAVAIGMGTGRFLELYPLQLLLTVFAVSLASIYGDLFASLVKRSLAVKDFGEMLPGHGGMLDRFDSLFFAAPAAYLCFRAFLG